jgi:glycosyltransferase involved in cell wall biosynthesis
MIRAQHHHRKSSVIVLVTDAWHPQVNGVVQTWTYMQRELQALGHALLIISPEGARGLPVRSEPGLKLCTEPMRHVRRQLAGRTPAALHIATEGPLGWAARRLAKRHGWRFTTSYHTRFPEYLQARYGLPAGITYRFMLRFHRRSQRILVPTEAMRRELEQRGFARLHVWARGVDAARFAPGGRDALPYERPIFLCVGRVAPEKNLEAFLSLELPGTKVIVGGGPDEARLKALFPQARWLGMQPHDELGRYYDAADVFVFPSRTDTFGLVMMEAMAAGCPVAAYPVTGPIDVVRQGVTGVLGDDLRAACLAALALDRGAVRREAERFTWRAAALDLLAQLQPVDGSRERLFDALGADATADAAQPAHAPLQAGAAG